MNKKSSMMLRCKRAVASVNWMLRLWREWICFIFAVYFYAKFQYPRLSKANMVKLFDNIIRECIHLILNVKFPLWTEFEQCEIMPVSISQHISIPNVNVRVWFVQSNAPCQFTVFFFSTDNNTWKIRFKLNTQNNSITTYEIGSNSCKNLWDVETQIYGFFKCSRMAQIINNKI